MHIKYPLNSGNLCIMNCFLIPKVSVIERFAVIYGEYFSRGKNFVDANNLDCTNLLPLKKSPLYGM